MKSTPAYICFSFLIFLTLADCSKKENGSTRIEFEALSGNLVLITGGGTNVIASAGKDGLLLVDTKLPEFTETIVKELTGDNPGKTLLVIDTHCHSDHVSGNKSWRERGALIAAHENTLIHLETGSYSPFWDERTPRPKPERFPLYRFRNRSRCTSTAMKWPFLT
jgi:glyoxylase-like metal-dependent hydrolase (beta-lactamase superfamily II)